jgi:catechol 2,3-dioxygenase-like lactoylglutathione lyase family enzyme
MTGFDVRIGQIAQVSLMVRDAQRAEAFYRDVLGLRHLFTFGDLLFFDAAGVRIYLHRKEERDWQSGSILYFVCDDIDRTHEALAARGVRFTGAPHLVHTDEATGLQEWMAFFEDGEGNTLALMSRVPADRAG